MWCQSWERLLNIKQAKIVQKSDHGDENVQKNMISGFLAITGNSEGKKCQSDLGQVKGSTVLAARKTSVRGLWGGVFFVAIVLL